MPKLNPWSNSNPICKPVYVALDVPTADEALALVRQLAPLGIGFKVGMQLFYAEGMTIIRDIQTILGNDAHPARIFVDLKLHDIPNTVAKASQSLVRLGVGFFNVHAQGGLAMMREASEAACEMADQLGQPKPVIIAVTLLTSLSQESLNQELNVRQTPAEYVPHLAKLAQSSGLDGVVCSAQEAGLIRRACGEDFLLVTPGIRPADASVDDQARVVTPEGAMANGADLLVIGRPITAAADPVAATERILESLAGFVTV
jgi:orotidine-5'-phosphate decarboxylase